MITLVSMLLFSCNRSDKGIAITLKNTADIDLSGKAIAVKRTALTTDEGDGRFPLVLNAQGDTIPSQTDDMNGDGEWDELFFLVDMPSQGEITVTLKHTDDSMAYEKRTSVRFGKRDSGTSPVEPKLGDTLYADQLPLSIGYQPYQTDGPSWENDKVGFRHYLDGRNAKDVFGKKVAYLSPSNVGLTSSRAVEDNYHVMADWGRDILAVGNSVGLGGVALKIGDEFCRLGVTVNDSVNNVERTIFHITADGPLRSSMDFKYENWAASERMYHVREQVSIWPGMYAYKNSVSIEELQGDETLLVGLVNIHTAEKPKEITVADEWVVLYTHDWQTYEKEWRLGLGLIVPKALYQGYIEAPSQGPLTNSYMAQLDISDGKPVAYYSVAGWELADQAFLEAEGFEQYIVNLAEQLAAEVTVNIIQ